MTGRIRKATPADAELLWQWRNDPLVRNNSFNSASIPWTEHEGWFSQRVASPNTRIYLLEDSGKMVAQIRYEKRNDAAEVGDISVAADDRGKGYGRQILSLTMSLACADLGVEKLTAVVKNTNTVSLRTFLSVGFSLQEALIERGFACSRFVYTCSSRGRA